jgi:hypothetical protein
LRAAALWMPRRRRERRVFPNAGQQLDSIGQNQTFISAPTETARLGSAAGSDRYRNTSSAAPASASGEGRLALLEIGAHRLLVVGRGGDDGVV